MREGGIWEGRRIHVGGELAGERLKIRIKESRRKEGMGGGRKDGNGDNEETEERKQTAGDVGWGGAGEG